MGKKKRQFIDKKNAHSYQLVHRSQKDPLQADEDSSAYVLQPFQQLKKGTAAGAEGDEAESQGDHLSQQRKFGVYYDDGYNYMQHLRDRGEGNVVEMEETMAADKRKNDAVQVSENLKLPGSVFASEKEEDVGLLNLAAPRPGPRLDMDPDIVEMLDEDFEEFVDAEDMEEFEDDFVLLANGGEAPGDLADVAEGGEDAGEDGDWEDVDTDDEEDDNDDDDDDDDDYDSDARSDIAVGGEVNDDDAYHRMMLGLDDVDDGRTRFTACSATSAVLKRNEGLKLLDARFEEELKKWDDDHFCEVPPPTLPPERMQALIDEFQGTQLNRPDLEALMTSDSTKDTSEYRRSMAAIAEKFRYEKSDDEEVQEMEIVMPSKLQFDAMSVRTVDSRTRQRSMPAVIPAPAKTKKKKSHAAGTSEAAAEATAAAPQPVVLDRKTGLPTGILYQKPKKEEAPVEDKEVNSALCTERRKDETPEERKLRKQATKDHKRERRVEKKANKQHFQHNHHMELTATKTPAGIRL